MATRRFLGLLLLLAGVFAVAAADSSIDAELLTIKKSKLPVFFFHGITGNRTHGANYVANLTAEGRTVVALTHCENECSYTSLKDQVPKAIALIRSTVASNPVFWNGYIFIGHSLGGLVARAVVESMDDHNVKKLISIAGVQNGLFYGPQDADLVSSPANVFFNSLIASGEFDYSTYTSADYHDGKVVYDEGTHVLLNPQVHYTHAIANMERLPVFAPWSAGNPFLPVINNVNPCAASDSDCAAAKAKRKANFLRVPAAYFFGSPDDGLVTPWQISLLGHTSEVNSLEEIQTQFNNFTIINMTATREYQNDTYGLQTLNKRGGLFLTQAPGINHRCWLYDYDGCYFNNTYAKYVYPLL